MNGVETALLSWLIQYRYLVIIPITIIEGPLIMLAGGFFVRLGVFDLVPMYFALMAGDLLGDIGWYAVGHYWGRPFIKRYGHYFSIDEKTVAVFEKFFHQWKNAILIISKITMGFGFAVVTLFTAGLVGVPFRDYMILNIVGEFVWTAVLMAAGFFLGNLYVTIGTIFGRISITAGVVVIAILLFGVGKYVRSEIMKKYS